MSLFVIEKARSDETGEVQAVLWAQVDGASNKYLEPLHEVQVDRVVEALDRGDTVEVVFKTISGAVSGGPLKKKILQGGIESVTTARNTPGQMLSDLPTF